MLLLFAVVLPLVGEWVDVVWEELLFWISVSEYMNDVVTTFSNDDNTDEETKLPAASVDDDDHNGLESVEVEESVKIWES